MEEHKTKRMITKLPTGDMLGGKGDGEVDRNRPETNGKSLHRRPGTQPLARNNSPKICLRTPQAYSPILTEVD